MTTRTVILAAGLGTRMRRAADGVVLTAEQERAAATGIKCLVPIAGRPFLDHLIDSLRRAGVERFAVVVGAEHRPLVDHCRALAREGLDLSTAIQATPRGTADALLAAEEWAGDRPFLMVNSDNHYPAADLRRLGALDGPGLLAVDRAGAVATGLSEEKLRAWAVVERDTDGQLTGLLEKPDEAAWRRLTEPVLLSTNAWRMAPDIFAACRRVAPSPRGELELPAAVEATLRARPDRRYRVVVSAGPVLDLTERADVARLERLWRRDPPAG